jgi:hypothetical protein
MQHRDLILDCLDDVDIGIRMRALELVAEFVTRRTLRDISRILVRKLRASSGALTGMSSGTLLYPSPDLGANDGRRDSTNAAACPEIPAPVSDLLLDPETPYREALAEQLLTPGQYQRGDGYPILSSEEDFVWYIATVLGGLARMEGLSRRIARLVGSQLIELISRVEAVRPATVLVAVALLQSCGPKTAKDGIGANGISGNSTASTAWSGTDGRLPYPDTKLDVSASTTRSLTSTKEGPTSTELCADLLTTGAPGLETVSANDSGNSGVSSTNPQKLPSDVVGAAAWVIGEYAEFHEDRVSAAKVLLRYPTSHVDGPAQVAMISALIKVFAVCRPQDAAELYSDLLGYLEKCLESEAAEVCERAWMFRKLVEQAGAESNEDLGALFEKKLLPVDHRAQQQVQAPEGLDIHSSFLDTRGMSLPAYLTEGDESYVTDEMGLDGEDAEDDDIFNQLKNGAGLLTADGSGFTDGTHRSDSSAGGARELFYLGDDGASQVVRGVSGDRDERNGFRDDATFAGQDNLLGIAKSRPGAPGSASRAVAVFTGEDVPTGTLVSEGNGRSRSNRGGASRVAPVLKDNRLDAAFEGAFSAGNSTNESGKPKRRRKKKSRSKDTANRESSPNLIDFGDSFASPSDVAVSDAARPTPKHIGPQSDLLM